MPNTSPAPAGKPSRRGGETPTVADVARAAGVSPMTVSRVVNGVPGVLPATRTKVERAAASLGYVPNQAARSLAGRGPCRVALLYGNPSAAWLSQVLVGALQGAAETGASLELEQHVPGEPNATLLRRLHANRIDAVLLPPPFCDDAALLNAVIESGLQAAQIATGAPAAHAHAVCIDDEAAAQALTAHLIGLGHRRIGFIAGDPRQTASALRQAGYAAALRKAGIAADPALIAQGDYTYRAGLNAAEALLSLTPRPTAIFASNDEMAAAAIAAAHRRQLDVPRDVSVCGFDDTALAGIVWPAITTIRQPAAEMARLALTALAAARRTGAPAPMQHIALGFDLVRRESDAPPRA